MEEVWEDINLSTLGHDSRSTTPSFSSVESPLLHYNRSTIGSGHHSFPGMILQDFHARPLTSPRCSAAGGDLPQGALPPTALSLCTSDFCPQGFHPGQSSSNTDSSFPAHIATAAANAFFHSNKHLLDAASCVAGSDRRHKRMIKNRESASRSRARKQAYTNEMELEVGHLAAENSKLKKQNEELRLAMAAQLRKRKAFQKSLSAPF